MQKKMRILTPLSNGVRWRKNVDKKIEEYIIGTRARGRKFVHSMFLTQIIKHKVGNHNLFMNAFLTFHKHLILLFSL